MNITSDPNLWAICALTFLLGLLIGVFLTAGGRRKWKTRYNEEISRREALERTHSEREAEWATREKDWREQESLRGAAAKSPGRGAVGASAIDRDIDDDGVRDDLDRRPTDDRKA